MVLRSSEEPSIHEVLIRLTSVLQRLHAHDGTGLQNVAPGPLRPCAAHISSPQQLGSSTCRRRREDLPRAKLRSAGRRLADRDS